MMTETAELTPHLDDAELVRYIDDEGNPLELARWRRHVERCEMCAREVALLDDQAVYVSGWLARVPLDGAGEAVDPPPARPPARRGVASFSVAQERRARRPAPRRRALTPWMRAAALIVLLAAPVAAFPSLRSWAGERLGMARGPDVTAAFRAGPTALVADGAGSALRFVPAAGAFVVEFDAAPAGGTLTLGRAAGGEAELEVAGAAGGGPVVSDRRVRIDGAAGGTASYALRLPAGVTEVTVQVAGHPLRTVGARELDAGAVIGLAP